MNFESYIREIPNFPTQGVGFKDITPILNDAQARKAMVHTLLEQCSTLGINKVVAIESRGFFLGSLLAEALDAGFVPVRKKGKLPFETIHCTYALEYGTDTLEMHKDAIKPGDKVLIHDDVLATGGTAKAACTLVNQLGGEIVACNFIIELLFLHGAKKIADYPIYSAIKYS